MAPSPVELSFDCAVCHVEAGAVETYDPLAAACRFGMPARTRCRLCQRREVGMVHPGDSGRPSLPLDQLPANACPSCTQVLALNALDTKTCASCGARAELEVIDEGHVPTTREALVAALEEWAADERYDGLDSFLHATFTTPSLAVLLADLNAGRPIETVPDPFARPGGAGSPGGGGEVRSGGAAHFAPSTAAALPRDSAHPRSAPPSAPPRAVLYPLVSVIAADGVIHPLERALVDRFLESEGLEPLADAEIRVHPPGDVAHLIPTARREAVIQLMCETASVDGAADASEIRVIRAYAAAWNVPPDKVDLWIWAHENMGEPFARLFWKRLRRFVLSSRWNTLEDTRR